MPVGTLSSGNSTVTFTVSANIVKTFNDLEWKVSAKYATHDRHIKRDLLEFLGPETQSIDFPVQLSALLGVNPIKEIENLNRMCESGQIARLVIGGKVYGSFKWVIESVSSTLQYFDSSGNCLRAEAKISLKEYPKR